MPHTRQETDQPLARESAYSLDRVTEVGFALLGSAATLLTHEAFESPLRTGVTAVAGLGLVATYRSVKNTFQNW